MSASRRVRRQAAIGAGPTRRSPGLGAVRDSSCAARRLSRRRCAGPQRALQGRVVNWDDIIIDAAATDTGMRRSNNQDSHAIVRASSLEAWQAARPPVHGRRRHGGPRRRRAGQQDGLRQHPAQLHQDRRPATPSEAITKAYREVGALIHSRATRQPRLPGDGDDLLDPPAPARGGPDRPRRRLAGLPHPQRADRPALVRPQPGLGAGPAQPPPARAGQPRPSPRT